VPLTQDHRATVQKERSRIESVGGQVLRGRESGRREREEREEREERGRRERASEREESESERARGGRQREFVCVCVYFGGG
jgi:hypothetical protein